MSKKLSIMGLIVSFVFVTAMVASAGDSLQSRDENPEHPEHPEHPEDGTSAFHVDKEAMAIAISDFINTDTKLKGGFFLFYDSKDKKPLALTLTKVHKDRLSQVGENVFFACSDFKEAGGTMYDLDFFLRNEGDHLLVTDVMVHKKEGAPRYTWHETKGVWKTRAVE